MPLGTQWGYALKGPSYLGIGPPVQLEVASPREPGLGESEPMDGTVTVRDLVPGQAYEVYLITDLPEVPGLADVSLLAGHTPWASFVADAPTHALPATFESGTPAYFVAVAAGEVPQEVAAQAAPQQGV